MVNKGKILVVDDNPGIRAALKILLPKYFAAVELRFAQGNSCFVAGVCAGCHLAGYEFRGRYQYGE